MTPDPTPVPPDARPTSLPPAPANRRQRLKHKIPRSWRQHWKIAATLAIFVLVLATAFGATRVRPYISGDPTVIASDITQNIAGSVDLFDSSVSHSIGLEYSDTQYRELVDSFENDGDKEWMTADVTIDGVLLTNVGVRLKGNSTLMSLRGDRGGMGEGGPARRGQRGPEGQQQQGQGGGAPAPGNAGAPAGGGLGGPGGTLSFDDPEDLPFLLSFNEFAKGRAYQGVTELSLRPYTPALNESVSLAITQQTGQPSQDFAYSTVSVNGGATSTRLAVVNPDDGYANSLFDGSGVLYKSDSTSRFEYQGDDQTTYSGQFNQINANGTEDLQPIISFLKWLDSAPDSEFDAHLADWVDVESFAKYLATQNIIGNFDDMSGPGKNYYLWFDVSTKKFSVVSWDLNMALNNDSTARPHDQTSMGGGGGGPADTGGAMRAAEGMEPPAGVELPEGMEKPSGNGGPGGMMSGNSLKERFLASSAFTGVYDAAYREIYNAALGNGRATDVVDDVVDSIPTSDNLTADDLATQADTMRTRLQKRADVLVDDPIITGEG